MKTNGIWIIFLLLAAGGFPVVGYAGISGDDVFLEKVAAASFRYFTEYCGTNGLLQDRSTDERASCTMAAGFQFPAYCIADYRGWISRDEAVRRTLLALRTYRRLPRFHGIYAHYYDIMDEAVIPMMHREDNGADVSETGFMMMGILTAAEYFNRDTLAEGEVRSLAKQIYDEIEWDWMLNDAQGRKHETLSWHWSPDFGFKIGQRVKSSMEISSMVTYLLAMGSETHPVPATCWDFGWTVDYNWGLWQGRPIIMCPPAFAHQYAQSWVDFRHMRDWYADYFRNSIYALSANRAFCLKELYPGTEIWGLTFCDAMDKYGIYGYPPLAGTVMKDAVIAPSGAGGSMPMLPRESIAAFRYLYDHYKESLWGDCGFRDSFSPKHHWFADTYLAIDQGITLLAIENLRSGLVWKYAMQSKPIIKGLARAGFVSVVDDFEPVAAPACPYAQWQTDSATGLCRIEENAGEARDGRSLLSIDGAVGMTLSGRLVDAGWMPGRYLSFWYKNAVIDEVRRGKALCRQVSSREETGGWTHAICSWPRSGGEFVSFSIRKADKTKPVLLDAVYVLNEADNQPPPAVDGLNVIPGKDAGTIAVHWKALGEEYARGACQMKIRVETNARGKDNGSFFQAEPVDSGNRPLLNNWENGFYLISGLTPGKEYSISACWQDRAGNRSQTFATATAGAGVHLSGE